MNSNWCPSNPPDDPAQTPEALEKGKQEYLIEKTIQQALRVIYGDRALKTVPRLSKDLAKELVKRGVVLSGIALLFWSLMD